MAGEEDAMRTLRFGLGALAGTAVLCSGVMVLAQGKKPLKKKGPACSAIDAQATCEGRNDCEWVAANLNKDGKVIRRAYCVAKAKKKA
jgi:hypothetical protein